jgi:predicted SnoaL-like aldol condensation-catalyzing enzyme
MKTKKRIGLLAAAIAAVGFTSVVYADDSGRHRGGFNGHGPRDSKCNVSKEQLDRNTKTAIAYYTLAFNDGLPRLAVQKYVGVDRFGRKIYTQHNPFAQDGPEAFIQFVELFKSINPGLHVDIKRTIAQCDLVMTHAHITTGRPDDLGNAAMDIFRFDKTGRIVEHWDAVQPVEANPANDNTQF